jgi:hypothetical protein
VATLASISSNLDDISEIDGVGEEIGGVVGVEGVIGGALPAPPSPGNIIVI